MHADTPLHLENSATCAQQSSSHLIFVRIYFEIHVEQLNEKFFNLLTVNTLLFENPSALKVQINFKKSLDRSS